MEEYLKRCERGMTTKTWRAMEEEMEIISSKKRKLYPELGNNVYGAGEVDAVPESSVSPAASRTSGESYQLEEYATDAEKKKSSDLENVHLQSECFETEIPTSVGRVSSRETTPTSELYGDSEQALLHSLPAPKKKPSTSPAISRRKIAEKMPSAPELEEFFAAAEKYDQKRFVEKYNYDIVKDVPLEGKYQWVRLHP